MKRIVLLAIAVLMVTTGVLAQRRGLLARSVAALEKAMELEFRSLERKHECSPNVPSPNYPDR